MSLTVLEVVSDALFPVAGATPPSTLASTTDSQQLKLKAILADVARELRRDMQFPAQKRTHEFTTIASTDSYQLPEDFFGLLFETAWDKDQQWPLEGPLSDSVFSSRKYRETGAIVSQFRMFGFDRNPNSAGGQFKVYPTPGDAYDFAFDYITASLFLPPNWLPSTTYVSGQYVNANGNIYLCDTNGTSGTTAPAGQGVNISDGTTQWDYVSAPYETVRTNDDLCLFDDELMVLGVRVGYLRGTGKDISKEFADYEDAKKAAKHRYYGNRRGSFGSKRTGPQYTIPVRGWSI